VRLLGRYRPARAVKPAGAVRPRPEGLEDRCVPSTDVVTSLSGSAAVPGSLPYEVANADDDTIQFAPNLTGGTITLGNTLDVIQNLAIDGRHNGITVSGGATGCSRSRVRCRGLDKMPSRWAIAITLSTTSRLGSSAPPSGAPPMIGPSLLRKIGNLSRPVLSAPGLKNK
jgi:hypothetical protein